MRLIDVDDLGVGRCSRDVVPAVYCAGWNGLLGLIEKAPTVDAVVVTRCKDCKHKLRTVANGVVICREKHGMVRPSLDDFCSYGEYQTNTGGSNNAAD